MRPLLPSQLATGRGFSALPCHLPAHGRGRGLAPALKQLLRRSPGSWDLPELPEIGGPLEPDGAVAEAQSRCAGLFGVDSCWFGVNGASGLLQAALLGLAAPGSRVLLPRNLHRSLLHGCVLGQLQPVLFDLPFDGATGLWQPPDAPWLERVLAAALGQGPLAAVVLVSPTYQGLDADLEPLVRLVHAAGLPLLVDQAHGRGQALAAGADLVVLSCQKAASGLAQSAVLLGRSGRVDLQSLRRSLLWLQTSSPSALLLASTEAALCWAHSPAGKRQRQWSQQRGRRLRQRCQTMGLPVVANQDPQRLVLHCAALGFTGLDADAWLMHRGVIAELPEPGVLTFCLGEVLPAFAEQRLPRVLGRMAQVLAADPLPAFVRPPLPLVAEPELSLGSAWRAQAERVPLHAAVGSIAAEPLCPYPPGIPLLIPGERIDAARAAWLQQQVQLWPGQIADTVKVVSNDGEAGVIPPGGPTREGQRPLL
jgi:lysine decarboxylase